MLVLIVCIIAGVLIAGLIIGALTAIYLVVSAMIDWGPNS